MNKAVMKEQMSPRRLARIAGVVYLFVFVAGILAAVSTPDGPAS